MVLKFSSGHNSSHIHIQKALLVSGKSHSQLFQTWLGQEIFLKGCSYPWRLPWQGSFWRGLARQGQRVCACTVFPPPFLSCLLLLLAGICKQRGKRQGTQSLLLLPNLDRHWFSLDFFRFRYYCSFEQHTHTQKPYHQTPPPPFQKQIKTTNTHSLHSLSMSWVSQKCSED